ncbi:MAG: EF-P lysine aminoacylase GenX [Magnetococcales bacterium]|nr:EF-P lysine aminoacylase GenX [Magnetococcales bacterium]NGZ25936.1 EF-P lysine aminoacylase GenX [Magnetococcales bacterium]
MPAASLQRLAARAGLLAKTRAFFAARQVLEVETPLLCSAPPAENQIEPLATLSPLGGEESYYLITSPETAMKRLLAAGSGAIYQICHTFRRGEAGRLHNPEFTMLEWYRPHWSMEQLMAEVFELVASHLPLTEARYLTFQEAFIQYCGVDPFVASLEDLQQAAHGQGLQPPTNLTREELLDFLLTFCIEVGFGREGGAIFLTHYPVNRAAMACIDPGPPATARRFELYVNGLELANGYQELTDAHEQEARLQQANQERQTAGLSPLPLDHHFLAALQAGMPPCSGVALGMDRLVMLATGANRLSEVINFPVDRC